MNRDGIDQAIDAIVRADHLPIEQRSLSFHIGNCWLRFRSVKIGERLLTELLAEVLSSALTLTTIAVLLWILSRIEHLAKGH